MAWAVHQRETYVARLGLWLLVLLWKLEGALGGGASLEYVNHWGQALRFQDWCHFLSAALCFQSSDTMWPAASYSDHHGGLHLSLNCEAEQILPPVSCYLLSIQSQLWEKQHRMISFLLLIMWEPYFEYYHLCDQHFFDTIANNKPGSSHSSPSAWQMKGPGIQWMFLFRWSHCVALKQ